MRILNKKSILAFVAFLVLALVSVTWISYIFADDENGAGLGDDTTASSVLSGKTIIDYIIDNSHKTADEENDPVYHIVELHSGKESALKGMVESYLDSASSKTIFKDYVFDGNKSSKQTLDFNNAKNIEYKSFNFTTASNDDIISAITGADFIYLSESNNNWTTVDLTEEVKDALNRYALTDAKPFMIDSHAINSSGTSSQSVSTIATNYFATEGLLYSTYSWPSGMAAMDFFNPANMSAVYIPLNGNNRTPAWINATKNGNVERIARVLTITSGSDMAYTNSFRDLSSSTAANKINTAFVGGSDTIENVSCDADSSIDDSYSFDNTYVLPASSAVSQYAYRSSGSSEKPSAIQFETLDISSNLDALKTKDLSLYDFVIIEAAAGNVTLGTEEASTIINSLYSDVYMLYPPSLIGSQDTGGATGISTNLKYIYDKVANNDNSSKYNYVLVTGAARMNIYSSATSGKTVKDIADIINAGTFRGMTSGGNGDSSSTYTVLEIEPCYPINDNLAAALVPAAGYTDSRTGDTFRNSTGRKNALYNHLSTKGFYYLRTDEVSSLPTDEISYGGGKSLTDVVEAGNYSEYISKDTIDNVVDYYDWSISKAKIAHATGRPYNQVSVVHMSSAEFSASRKTLLDNYDAIFIGGNYTAIKDDVDWNTVANNLGDYYTMYFHNGDTYSLPTNKHKQKDNSGKYGVLSGNDITESKYQELVKYAQSMPVIISDDLTSAYSGYKSQGNKQHLLDPKSNMCKLLDAILVPDADNNYVGKDSYKVLSNYDFDYTIKAANEGGKYGKTYGGYATVFAGVDDTDYLGQPVVKDPTKLVDESHLSNLLKTARPLMYVTKMPTIYNDTDDSTWIETRSNSTTTIKWEADIVSAATPTVNLYIDSDHNGLFNEPAVKSEEGNSVSLSYPIPEDFYGVIYWKLEAVTGNVSTSTVNVCKVKRRDDQEKLTIDLLEIMPYGSRDTKYSASSTRQAANSTLFLCTECQTAKTNLRANRYTPTGKYYKGTLGGQNTFSNQDPGQLNNGLQSTNDIVSILKKFDSGYEYNGSWLGTHTHNFGIVKYYSDMTIDGETGIDDITTNWFDIVKDDYTVNTTIKYTDELDSMVSEVESMYANMTPEERKVLVESTEDKEQGTSSGYNEKANKYNSYYLGIQKLINGEYSNASGTFSLSSFKSENLELYTLLHNYGLSDDKLTDYAEASYNIDNYLTSNRSAIISSNNQKHSAMMGKEIDFETDPSIDRDKRNYYDMFSMYGSYSDTNIGLTSATNRFSLFCEYFSDWRDIKILENFFWDNYQQNKLYSAVDYETGLIDLTKVYSCIALGASEEFGGGGAGSDLNVQTCKALSRYIDENGNVLLFHDSLTSTAGTTTNMSEILSEKFGMDARHLIVGSDDDDAKELIKERSITANYSGSNLSITMGQQKDLDYFYRLKITKPSTNTKIYMYVANADVVPSATNFQYSWSPDKFAQVYDVSDYRIGTISPNGGFGSTLNSVTGTIKFGKDNNEYRSNDSSVAFGYDNDSSSININLNIQRPAPVQIDHGTWTETRYEDKDTTDTYYLIVCCSETNPFYADKKLDAEKTVVIPIKNGVPTSVSTGKPTLTWSSRTNSYGNINGYTTDTNKQQLSVSIAADDINSIIGKSITFTDSNGLNETGTFVLGEYNDEPVARATIELDNWKLKDNSIPSYMPKAGYSKDKYFLSPIGNDLLTTRMLSYEGFYSTVDDGNQGDKQNYSMFKYSTFFYGNVETDRGATRLGTAHMDEAILAMDSDSYVTNKTQKNNQGIITLYPFGIPDNMRISATVPGNYSLDIENDDLVVYYSMTGGTAGTQSSLFAADPNDGANNYFLYQYGSVTYTGAGHSLITGYGRENNDERKLFINVILNSAKKSIVAPSLDLYDLDSSGKGNKNVDVVPTSGDCDYYTAIENIEDFKGFDFLATIPSSQLSHVQIYWNVNHTADANNEDTGNVYKYDTDTDFMIFDSDRVKGSTDENSVLEGLQKAVKAGIKPSAMDVVDEDGNVKASGNVTTGAGLKHEYVAKMDSEGNTYNEWEPRITLKEKYFDKDTGGEYAYIVVQITDANKNKRSKVLRIQYKPELIDLN